MKYRYETIKYNDNLPARIENCVCTASDLHWHKEIELIFIANGNLTVFKNEAEYSLYAGDFFLFNSKEIHQLTPLGDNVRLVTLHLSYDFAKNFESQLDMRSFVVAPGSRAEQELKEQMRSLSDGTLSTLQQYAVIMNILHVLFEQCMRERQISLYGNCKVSFRNAKLAMEYIEEHYREELNLNVMAELVGLNPIYFSKYFKDSTGMGFNAYVNSVRMKHALEDLMAENMSIADAASYNGFPNVKSFENACKRSYGVTPLQFKKRQLMVS